MGWRKNSESHSMDYVRHGKIQWQWTLKKTKEWPCISPCLTYIICPLHPVEIGLTDGTTGLSTTIFQPITTKRCNLNCRSELRQWQGRRKVWKSEGASNTVVGIICPPGWDRVNCLAKKLGPPSPTACDGPAVVNYFAQVRNKSAPIHSDFD